MDNKNIVKYGCTLYLIDGGSISVSTEREITQFIEGGMYSIFNNDWFDWLQNPDNKSFIYEQRNSQRFNVRKENKDTTDEKYWYAIKKVKGQRRCIYIGTSYDLTEEKLKEISSRISQSE